MPSQTSDDAIISDILNKDIIALLGLENLPVEQQEEYRQKALQTVNDRAFVRITDILDGKGLLEAFEAEDRDEVGTTAWLAEHGIDLEQMMVEEALLYKAQMKTMADVIDAGIDITPKAE